MRVEPTAAYLHVDVRPRKHFVTSRGSKIQWRGDPNTILPVCHCILARRYVPLSSLDIPRPFTRDLCDG